MENRTKRNDLVLIRAVETNTLLYAATDPNFKNKQLQEVAWANIADILKMQVEECQRRWTVLRTRYNKEKRENKFRPLIGAPPRKEWYLSAAMSFIEPYLKKRRSNSFKMWQTGQKHTGQQEQQVMEYEQKQKKQTQIEQEQSAQMEQQQQQQRVQEVKIETYSLLSSDEETEETNNHQRETNEQTVQTNVKQSETPNAVLPIAQTNKELNLEITPEKEHITDYNICTTLYGQLKIMKDKQKKKRFRRKLFLLMSEIESEEEDEGEDIL